MRNQILSMGEALVDVLPAPGGLWKPVAGGSSYNVALALGRLGAPCAFLGRLSRDGQGERMLRALRSAGVDISRCARDSRPSPLSLVAPGSETTSARYSIYIEGTAHAPPELAADWLDAAAHLHVSSFSAIAGAWGRAVESALVSASETVSTSFDVNIRENLIPPRAETLALIERRLALVDVVKASDEDLRWLVPGSAPGAVAADWAARFSCLVILTQGAGGASAYFADRSIVSPAAPARVVDTVGAGDAFIAAFLACAVADRPLTKASLGDAPLGNWLGFANAAAALCCSRSGADPATRTEIEDFKNSF